MKVILLTRWYVQTQVCTDVVVLKETPKDSLEPKDFRWNEFMRSLDKLLTHDRLKASKWITKRLWRTFNKHFSKDVFRNNYILLALALFCGVFLIIFDDFNVRAWDSPNLALLIFSNCCSRQHAMEKSEWHY